MLIRILEYEIEIMKSAINNKRILKRGIKQGKEEGKKEGKIEGRVEEKIEIIKRC